MNRQRHFILEGHEVKPVDLMTWARWLDSNVHNRTVAKTHVSNEVLVSTVFLGLDHNWSDEGPPLIFETLVFGGPHDGEEERYSTWAEAEAGHALMVVHVGMVKS